MSPLVPYHSTYNSALSAMNKMNMLYGHVFRMFLLVLMLVGTVNIGLILVYIAGLTKHSITLTGIIHTYGFGQEEHVYQYERVIGDPAPNMSVGYRDYIYGRAINHQDMKTSSNSSELMAERLSIHNDHDNAPVVSGLNQSSSISGITSSPVARVTDTDSNDEKHNEAHSLADVELQKESHPWYTHSAYRRSLDPDNWQTVDKNISYVYSAHLHPDSNETVSVVQVLGALREDMFKDMNSTHRQKVQCKLWNWSRGSKEPAVTVSKVEEIILHYGIRG